MAQQAGPGPDVCHELDPNDAQARGYAVPLRVKVNDQALLAAELPNASSELVGPGNLDDHQSVADLKVPPSDGSIARVRVIGADSVSRVEPMPDLSSHQRSTAEVANVSILNGRITANVVKANADVRTSQSMADVTGNLTAHLELRILGGIHNIQAPNTKIPLDTIKDEAGTPDDPSDDFRPFGKGSWVKVHERIDYGRFPEGDQPWYIGEQTVRMLHVKVTTLREHGSALALPVNLDIVVSEAYAYAQTPTPYCVGIQGINADATVMKIKSGTAFWKPSIVIGHSKVAHTGGWAEQNWTDVRVDTGTHILTAEAMTARATGVVTPGVVSKSTAVAKVAGLCLFSEEKDGNDEGDCIVKATAIRSESHSRAWHDEANSTDGPDYDTMSYGGSYVLDLWVLGTDICAELGLENINGLGCKPPKNTHLQIGSLHVYLNERQRDLDPEGHTEYVVRAVRIEGELGGQPIAMTIGRAYTEADYGASDDCTPTATNSCKM